MMYAIIKYYGLQSANETVLKLAFLLITKEDPSCKSGGWRSSKVKRYRETKPRKDLKVDKAFLESSTEATKLVARLERKARNE